MKLNSYFKNEKLAKIIMSVLLFLIIMLVAGIFVVKAEDNETKKVVLKEWTTQLLYDTTNACYEGTIRWIVMTHPSLIGQMPGLASQRQMIVHCFCVMDRIRKETKIEVYQKKVFDEEWAGTIFMLKAMECVKEEQTLPSFFISNKTITIPKILVPDRKTEDSQESPDQQEEESEEFPETIFQG